MSARTAAARDAHRAFLDPRLLDSEDEYVGWGGLPDDEIEHAMAVMAAMRRWRESEQRSSEASRRYMRLGETDMRALRYLIVEQNRKQVVTASDIAHHLGISSASTTKLLDRLAAGGHIERRPHPVDRRALAIVVSPETRTAARETIGRRHARRFAVAAALTAQERETVIGFLDALSAADAIDTAVEADRPQL
ncbi:MarR family winged helix-turn-helix transcriptional regulator [Bogoriella caseilytica]|uniref:MarR family transcriptional regulator n=1 Tax=Bogoriella caseilytica TaxID=56055 RepID=A0A3N2BCP0_9MICO|nr:MarR family transcriptional regulator [Bogoriella caseilytica]ROR73020.1 MarR family transcriptional regulator [Bogoriella caseilytica]